MHSFIVLAFQITYFKMAEDTDQTCLDLPAITLIFLLASIRICLYTTLTNFSMKYLVMSKVYTDVGGIR